MLAKANRLRSADDFRVTSRSGLKVSSANLVIYIKRDLGLVQSRFGFVVAKTVGGAVTRNLVKRRLRAAAAASLGNIPANLDVVVRALPTASEAGWNILSTELEGSLAKGLDRLTTK